MKTKRNQFIQSLFRNKSLVCVCAAAIAASAGVRVVVISCGTARDINVNQSVARQAKHTSEDVLHRASAQLSISRNPVVRIYDKVARLNQLQRALHGLPHVPMHQLRPTSLQLQCAPGVSEEQALKSTEKDLDEQIERLERMLLHDA